MTGTKYIGKCEIIVLLVMSSMFELAGFILFGICMKASSRMLVDIDNSHDFVMTIILLSILIVAIISVGIILYVINHSRDSALPLIMIAFYAITPAVFLICRLIGVSEMLYHVIFIH